MPAFGTVPTLRSGIIAMFRIALEVRTASGAEIHPIKRSHGSTIRTSPAK